MLLFSINTKQHKCYICGLFSLLFCIIFENNDCLFVCFLSLIEEEHDLLQKESASKNYTEEARTEIKVDGKVGWDKLKVLMSRSTTPDLIKMLGKLHDFFSQQQRSGMHAFAARRRLSSSSSLPLGRSISSRPVIRRIFTPDETNLESQNDGIYKITPFFIAKTNKGHFTLRYVF